MRLAIEVRRGARLTILHPRHRVVNLYGCVIGDDTRPGGSVKA